MNSPNQQPGQEEPEPAEASQKDVPRKDVLQQDVLQQEVPYKKPGLLQIVGSVMSAAIGIQSSKNQQRDFQHGRFRNFIIAGIVFVVIFIGTVFTVVTTVLKGTGVGH